MYENSLFKTPQLSSNTKTSITDTNDNTFGLSFNITKQDENYVISGSIPNGTYLEYNFYTLIDNFKKELHLLNRLDKSSTLSCHLTEPQLGVYLDEITHEKGCAYSCFGYYKCKSHTTLPQAKQAIKDLINYHPVLKARIDNSHSPVMLVCDSKIDITYIENADNFNYTELIYPFDLNKSMSRFWIINKDNAIVIAYDMHHIISDATSRTLINKYLGNLLYTDKTQKFDSGFLYASIETQKQLSSNKYTQAQKVYDKLLCESDLIPGLVLSIKGENGSVTLAIDNMKTKIETFCERNSTTPGTFLNIAFGYTLSRFTGSDKSLYTFTTNGRRLNETKNALGMYVETLPIVLDCADTKVSNFIENSTSTVLDVMEASIYPFRLLSKKYNITKNILFEYNNTLNDVSSITKEGISKSHNVDKVSEILCVANNWRQGYTITLSHTDKYSQDFALTFIKTYKLILLGLLEADKLSDINLVTKSDISIFAQINKTETSLKYDDILQAFTHSLNKYSNNALVTYKDKTYTYAQGACIAQSIANTLDSNHIKQKTHIAILVNRSEWYILASLGILTHGSVYVPIDDTYPDSRVAFMLKDTSSSSILVTDKTKARAEKLIQEKKINTTIINLSEINIPNASQAEKQVLNYTYSKPDKHDTACILYTSGTTGKPKGSIITHMAIANLSEWYIHATNLNEQDVYGMYVSNVFDMHTLAYFPPLYVGASMNVVPYKYRLNLRTLNDYFVSHKCTHTYITSQVGKLFAQSGYKTTIKLLCFGGMKLGALNAPDEICPFESYGPTENLAISTYIFANDRCCDSNIGSFVYNTKGYILDANKHLVPKGAVGELYLSGYQLATGYLNRKRETNNAFIDNPFDGDKLEYTKIYKTGDMVRLLPDNTLGFIGRRDSQIKIRGNRVEVSEVETCIRELEQIKDVTVQAIVVNKAKELVAYCVLDKNADKKNIEQTVKTYVSQNKPAYMVPAFVEILEKIPLNANGKIDKRKLPTPDATDLKTEYIPAQTKTQALIINAFEKVLGINKIGINDDFVRLGGDSLSAIKVVSMLKDINVSANDLLTYKTPSSIEKAINGNELNKPDLDIELIKNKTPLNEPQLNVYLDIMKNNKIDSYLIHNIIVIDNKYSYADVVSAINRIHRAHSILNKKIFDDESGVFLIDTDVLDISEQKTYDEQELEDFITKPFHLNINLSRYLIVRKEDQTYLISVFHHIIFDGLSNFIFKSELDKALQNKNLDQDYLYLYSSAFAKSIKDTDKYREACNFFERELCEANELSDLLPDIDGKAGCYTLTLDANLERIKDFTKNISITSSTFMTSVFAYTLSRYTGSDKVLLNLIDNGRDRFKDVDTAIGMFVNTLPIIFDCVNTDIKDYLKSNNTKIYKTLEYDFMGYRNLANKFDIKPNVMFQYDPVEYFGNIDIDNTLDINIHNHEAQDFISDISVNVIEDKNKIHLSITHSNKYSHSTIKSIARCFNMIVSGMLTKNRLSDINLVTEADLDTFSQINKTEKKLKYDDILQAFTHSLNKYPNNALVKYKDKTYTYAQGAYIATQIANLLEYNNIKQKSNIAILVNRSEWYMFASLGVLTHGSAYVPIDDTYPDARISFMLKDTKASAVLVTKATKHRTLDILNSIKTDVTIIEVDRIKPSTDTQLFNYHKINPKDNAFIVYTSGTTGDSKAIQITRQGIINNSEWYVSATKMQSNDVYCLYSAFTFDMHMVGFYPCILTGATLDIVPKDIRLNLDALNKHLNKVGATHTYLPTHVGKAYAEQNYKSSLKILLVIGEKLGEFIAPKNIGMLESYGPTETLTFTTAIKVNRRYAPNSIGYPIANTKVYVLDTNKNKIPMGAVGELYISTKQISNGYLNQPELTNKVFLDNPFDGNTLEYKKMYATGDMVRFLPNSSIGFIGRKDSQVKIRGNRVETGEVESCIRELDYVNDVAVLPIKTSTTKKLCAFCVCSKKTSLPDSSYTNNIIKLIKQHVAHCKPDYMVPSYVCLLDNLPLNTNGKIDRLKLVKHFKAENLYKNVDQSNLSHTEKKIISIVSKELDVPTKSISPETNLHDIGLDSLTTMRISYKLAEHKITVDASFMLQHPYIFKWLTKSNNKTYIHDPKQHTYPLTNGSLRNLYTCTKVLKSYNAFVNNVVDCICIKNFSYSKVKNLLKSLLDLHPQLKAKLVWKDNKPYFIKRHNYYPIKLISTKELPTAEYLGNFIKPFDLKDGNLCRIYVIQYKQNSYILLHVNHCITDAVSLKLFYGNLIRLLNNKIPQREDRSIFEYALISKKKYDTKSNLDYYKSIFDTYEFTSLPMNIIKKIDKINPILSRHCFSLTNKRKIKNYCKDINISFPVFFMCNLLITLKKYSKDGKVMIKNLYNGRKQAEFAHTFGNFIYDGPIYYNFNKNSHKIINIAKKINVQNEYNFLHGINYYEIDKIKYYRDKMIDILFHYSDETGLLPLNTKSIYSLNPVEVKYDDLKAFVYGITSIVTEKNDHFEIRLNYCKDVYTTETIKEFCNTYINNVTKSI